MRLKIQCTNVVPNASIWQYTVGDHSTNDATATSRRQNRDIAEIDFCQGRLGGWLEGEARRSILRKVRAEARGTATGAAKTGRSNLKIQKWCQCVTET